MGTAANYFFCHECKRTKKIKIITCSCTEVKQKSLFSTATLLDPSS